MGQGNGDFSVTSKDVTNAKVLIVSTSLSCSEWVPNFCCSYLMYLDLSAYKIDGAQVLLGNNVSCKVNGICNNKLEIFDGSIKILSNVRHVLRLKNK